MIRAFLDAMWKRATKSNIEEDFRSSGIFLIDRNIPLSSEYTVELTIDDLYLETTDELVLKSQIDWIKGRELNTKNTNRRYEYKLVETFISRIWLFERN